MTEGQKQDEERILAVLDSLAEHFDCVQIFVNRREEGSDVRGNYGKGNYYARYGQIKQWILIEEEAARMKANDD